jgi:Trypsin
VRSLIFIIILYSSFAFGMAGGLVLLQSDPAARSVLGIYIIDRVKKTGNLCTGTIVGRQTVLTAAHCFDDIGPKDADITLAFGSMPYLVLINKAAQQNPENYRRTSLFVVNPNYKSKGPLAQKLANDVALIFLNLNESFPSGYQSLSVINAYTLSNQPEKAFVNGVGRESSTDAEADPAKLVFKTDVFETLRDVNQILREVNAREASQISDNILQDFGSSNAPFYLVRSNRAVLHKGDSGSALIQNYYGSLRVVGVLKGSLSLGGKEMGSAFTNLHQPTLNRWVHNNIR